MSEPIVLITGASGFLGRGLSRAVEARNFKSVLLSSNKDFLKSSPGSIAFHIGDTTFPDLVPSPTHCVHLAWAIDRGRKAQEMSYESTLDLARQCAEQGIKMIFVSSMSAAPKRPRSNYGKYKRMCEGQIQSMGHSVVRLGTVLATEEQGGSAINQLLELPRLAKMLIGLLKPITLPITRQETFNEFIVDQWIANPHSDLYTVIDSVQTLQSLLGTKAGKLPLFILGVGSQVLPEKIGDRVKTLIDLQSLGTN